MSHFYFEEDEDLENPYVDIGPEEDDEIFDNEDEKNPKNSKIEKAKDVREKVEKRKDFAKSSKKSVDTGKQGLKSAKKGANAAKTAKKGTDAAKAAKTVGNAGKFAKFIAPMMPWIIYVIIAIAIIIAVTGLLMFVLTMPGMILGKLKGFAQGFGNAIINIVVGKGDNVKPSQVAEVGDYLEQMGYDLHAYGFLSDQVVENSSSYKLKYSGDNVNYDSFWDSGKREFDKASMYASKQGVLRDKNGVIYIESDYIKAYLVSDNYIYMIKNNENTLANVWKSITEFHFFRTLLGGNFGNGLINLYKEKSLGVLGDNYGFFDSVAGGIMKLFPFAGTSVDFSIDRDSKTMVVTSYPDGFYGLKRKFIYSLDGFTGRYGMPLEFLLALHISSMEPDLALDLVKRTDTEIQMITHSSDVRAEGGIKIGGTGEVLDKAGLEKKRDEEVQALIDERNEKRGNSGTVFDDLAHLFDDEYNAIGEEYNQKINAVKEKYKSYIDDVNKLNKTFATAVPYIYRVKNHWYRDVYFSDVELKDFITTDVDFEARTGQRWTMYETVPLTEEDKEGHKTADSNANAIQGDYSSGGLGKVKYKLYTYDSSGNEIEYIGDEDEENAKAKDPNVHKKAIMKTTTGNYKYFEDADDDYEGLISGRKDIWVAYKEDIDSTTGWQKYEAGKNDEIEVTNGNELYYKITFASGIAQIEDGQRGATNLLAKQIFSQNKYYQYDGTEERAIAIDLDRNNKNADGSDNGKDTKEQLKKYRDNEDSTINTNNDPRDENLISTFSISRDSMSAFNILTNMETLDSDYIYHDFKELIVELDFFDKEELAIVEYQTFEWPIPEAGSYGWPKRAYEKMENEFGTLMHTKNDLDFLKDKARSEVSGEGPNPTSYPDFSPEESSTGGRGAEGNVSKSVAIETDSNSPEPTINDTNSYKSIKELFAEKEITAIQAKATQKATGGFTQSEWLETAQTIWSYLVDQHQIKSVGYGSISSIPLSPGPSSNIGPGKEIDCSGLVSWCLWEYFNDDPAIKEHFSKQKHTNELYEENYTEMFGWEEIPVAEGENVKEKLEPGDILVRFSGFHDEEGEQHHTCIIKEVKGSQVLSFDCGGVDHWKDRSSRDHTTSTGFASKGAPGKIIRVGGSPKKIAKPYIGLDGGQYVVSPVTGMVLECGTKQKITNLETGMSEQVGFIKIRVLDLQDYNKYVKSKADSADKKTRDKYVGYKYFYEEYMDTEVTGNIMYIEGFSLELFDDKYKSSKDISITSSNVVEQGNVINKYTKTTYDDVFNKKAREILEEKEKARDAAIPYFKTDDGVIIKEGTVIGTVYGDGDSDEILAEARSEMLGRTIRKRKLPDDSPLLEREITVRPGVAGPDSEDNHKLTKSEIKQKGNGNYIRYIMRTSKDGSDRSVEKDSVIENVENYIELDELEYEDNDWILFYWLPFECGAVDTTSPKTGKYRKTGPVSFCSCSTGETAIAIIQWTALVKSGTNNMKHQFLPWFKENSPEFWPTLAFMENWSVEDWWNDWSSGEKKSQAALIACDKKDHKLFLHQQFECAKENEYEPMLKKHPWLKNRPKAVQAEILHYQVWTGHTPEETDSWQSLSNEDILLKIRHYIANTGSTVGPPSRDESKGRAWNEPEIGLRILDGTLTSDDIEQFVRNGDFDLIRDRGVELH